MRRLTTILLALGAPVLGLAQAVLYVASGNGNLSDFYTVNPATAQATLVGEVLIGGTTPVVITGLAVHPGTGVLYGITGNEYSPSRVLVTIDPQTAFATSVGVVGASSNQNASDISFAANGALFGWTVKGGPLVSIDPGTAARTVIGTAMNGTQGNGLAFAPNGTLYVAGPNDPGDLYTVNTGDGSITVVAPLSNVPLNFGPINAMASDAGGTLFVSGRGSSHLLATINPATGVMTAVGSLGFEADALAFAPIPEPAVTALLCTGLVGLGWCRRRRA